MYLTCLEFTAGLATVAHNAVVHYCSAHKLHMSESCAPLLALSLSTWHVAVADVLLTNDDAEILAYGAVLAHRAGDIRARLQAPTAQTVREGRIEHLARVLFRAEHPSGLWDLAPHEITRRCKLLAATYIDGRAPDELFELQ